MQPLAARQQRFDADQPERRRGNEQAGQSAGDDRLRVGQAAVARAENQDAATDRGPESLARAETWTREPAPCR